MSLGGPSFWLETTPDTDYPALTEGVSVDVAVVGAGITGVAAAVLLKRAGKTVALVEAKRIVCGATGYTTAKVTAGHGLSYTKIRDSFGADGARIYAEANQGALERIAQFVEEDGIDCDFERKPNYAYAEDDEQAKQVEREVEVEREAGLPVALVRETPLPFEVKAALRMENQAQFHPRKYLLTLAATIPGDGSHVFENSRVTKVKHGEPCEVETEQGKLRARDVILATHLPFLDRGLFFTKAYAHRSYAVAAPIGGAPDPEGMYINAGTPTRSVRRFATATTSSSRWAGTATRPATRTTRPRATTSSRSTCASTGRKPARCGTAGRRRTTWRTTRCRTSGVCAAARNICSSPRATASGA